MYRNVRHYAAAILFASTLWTTPGFAHDAIETQCQPTLIQYGGDSSFRPFRPLGAPPQAPNALDSYPAYPAYPQPPRYNNSGGSPPPQQLFQCVNNQIQYGYRMANCRTCCRTDDPSMCTTSCY